MAEKLKTAAIVLLTVSLIGLLGLSFSLGIYGLRGNPIWPLGSFLTRPAPAPARQPEFAPLPAAWPATVTAVGSQGARTAVTPAEYDALYLGGGAYPGLRGVYHQALGSSGAVEAIGREAFVALLAGPALHLSFDRALPLWLHYAWAEGRSDKPDLPVKTLVVAQSGEGVVLAFSTGEGQYYQMPTGTSAEDLSAACDAAEGESAGFAFEYGGLAGLSPDDVICRGEGGFVEAPVYRARQPGYSREGKLPRHLLEAFSLRYYMSSHVVSAGGLIRYVDGVRELTVDTDDRMSLRLTAEEEPATGGAPAGSREELLRAVEYARAAVSGIWESAGALGQLSVDYIDYEAETGVYTIGFELRVGGLYVDLAARPAYVVITGGYPTLISVRPCIAAAAGSERIPYLQYAAAAGPAAGRVGLGYGVLELREDEQPYEALVPRVGVIRGD